MTGYIKLFDSEEKMKTHKQNHGAGLAGKEFSFCDYIIDYHEKKVSFMGMDKFHDFKFTDIFVDHNDQVNLCRILYTVNFGE